MDGAAVVTEERAGNKPQHEDTAAQSIVGSSAGDAADGNRCSITCDDCGLIFTHVDVFNTHLHQHALEEEEEEEEEEEVQMGDGMKPTADLEPGIVDSGENGGGSAANDADGCGMSSSLQANSPTQGVSASTTQQPGKIHTCSVCGKVYTYWVSFSKHIEMHESESTKKSKDSSVQAPSKYHCPHCDMSFIRRARLLGHLRVHRPLKPKFFRCDHCSKVFNSQIAWKAHFDLHKERLKHKQQREQQRKKRLKQSNMGYKCDICHKIFRRASQLMIHHNSHTGAKPYHCTFCGKCFSQPGNLIRHKNKKHERVHPGSSGTTPQIGNSETYMVKPNRLLMEREMNVNTQVLSGEEKHVKKYETEKLHQGPEHGDRIKCESDWRELAELSDSAGFHLPDKLKSETLQQQTVKELDYSELQGTDLRREHQEWVCVECDMGFDEVAKLHLHYIKHATGELPIPQDDAED